MGTGISWTDDTLNCVHGCVRCSAACREGAGCFAEDISRELGRERGGTDSVWTPENAQRNIRVKYSKIQEIDDLRRTSREDWTEQIQFGDPYPSENPPPARVFMYSMSDFFLPQIPEDFTQRVVERMRDNPEIIFQILTKRPGMHRHLDIDWPANVWLGVSCEKPAYTNRIEVLREIDVSRRFVSFEPLLEPIPDVDLSGIDWAIVGGQSGQDYIDMDHAWAVDLYEQAHEQDTSYFFKQSAARKSERGTKLQFSDGSKRQIREFPSVPQVTVDAHTPTQQSLTDF
jgi:protein gp37